MLNYVLFFTDILSIILAIIGCYFAYQLWNLLGRHGITLWLMAAMIWAILLRMISIFKDFNLTWTWLNYSRQFAFPLYLFLAIGMAELFAQVKGKMEGNGHGSWLKKLFRKRK